MVKRAVITGLGVICPSGMGKRDFTQNLMEGNIKIAPITRFDTDGLPMNLAGEVKNFNATDFISPRWVKKCDRFSHFALAATQMALEDSKLDLKKEASDRIGIAIGNNVGGWEFYEKALYELYQQGSSYVNPYVASAWFPGAPQGLISIIHNIKGISKTTIADQVSGMMALGLATRYIQTGQADIVIAGGTEAPIAPYAMLCYHSSGRFSEERDVAKAYKPFSVGSKGMVIGEGSGILVIEEYEHALRREAYIYGELKGHASTKDRTFSDGGRKEGLSRAVITTLERASVDGSQIDYICAEGGGTEIEGKEETAELKKAFGERAKQIPISVPKSMFGHLYGGASSVDLISTIMATQDGFIPPTANFERPAPDCDLDYIPNKAVKGYIKRALLYARSSSGINSSIVVEKITQ